MVWNTSIFSWFLTLAVNYPPSPSSQTKIISSFNLRMWTHFGKICALSWDIHKFHLIRFLLTRQVSLNKVSLYKIDKIFINA